MGVIRSAKFFAGFLCRSTFELGVAGAPLWALGASTYFSLSFGLEWAVEALLVCLDRFSSSALIIIFSMSFIRIFFSVAR